MNSWQFTGPPPRRWLARKLARNLSARRGRIGRGPGAGLLIDPGGTNPGFVLGTTEPAVQGALLRCLRPGDVFFDVGANVGFFSIIAARLVGETGSVYAFEPVPEYADLVERNAQQNGFTNVRVVRRAVSAKSGADTLLRSGRNSPPGTDRLQSVSGGDPDRQTLDVATVSIDELVTSGELRPPSLVKIDVEGGELEVIRGMTTTIERHSPILIVELHWTGAEFLALAREALPNYEITRLGDEAETAPGPSWVHVVATPRASWAG